MKLKFNIRSLCSVEDDAAAPGGGTEKVERQNLTTVIEAAAVEAAKTVPIDEEETKGQKVTQPEDKEGDDKKEDPAKQEEDLSAEQVTFAKSLFKALNNSDPNIQRNAVKILANAAGLDLKEVETKKEVIEVKETLLDLLKSGLGEYDFLAEKLAPVLEKALNKSITEHTKDIREELKVERESKIRSEISTSIDNAFAKYENSLEVKDEVVKLMDQFKPGKGVSHQEYFDSMIKLAASNKDIVLKKLGDKSKTLDESKVKKTRSDVIGRLSSERGPEPKIGIKTPGKMNLNEAVRQAVEALASEK